LTLRRQSRIGGLRLSVENFHPMPSTGHQMETFRVVHYYTGTILRSAEKKLVQTYLFEQVIRHKNLRYYKVSGAIYAGFFIKITNDSCSK